MRSLCRVGIIVSGSLVGGVALAAYPDCIVGTATPGAVAAWRTGAVTALKTDFSESDDGTADIGVATNIKKCYPTQVPSCLARTFSFTTRDDVADSFLDGTAANLPEKQPPAELLAPGAQGLQYFVPDNFEQVARSKGWPVVRYKSRHSGGFDSSTASLMMVYVPGDKVNPPVNYDRWLNFALVADTGPDAQLPSPKGRIANAQDFAAELASVQAMQQAMQQFQQQQQQQGTGSAVGTGTGTGGIAAGTGLPTGTSVVTGTGTGTGVLVAPPPPVGTPVLVPAQPLPQPPAHAAAPAPAGAHLLDQPAVPLPAGAGGAGTPVVPLPSGSGAVTPPAVGGAVGATGSAIGTDTSPAVGQQPNTAINNNIFNSIPDVEFPRTFTMVTLDKATDTTPAKVYFQLFFRENLGSGIYTPAGNAMVEGCNGCHPNGMRAISPLGYHVRAGEPQLSEADWNAVKVINDAMEDDAGGNVVSWRDATVASGGGVKPLLKPTSQWPIYGALKPMNAVSRTQAYIMGGTLPDGTTTPGCYKARPTVDVSDIFNRPPGQHNTYTLSANPQINWMKVRNAMRCEACHNNRMRNAIHANIASDEVDFKILVDQSMPMGLHQNPLDQGSASLPPTDSLTPDERIALANCLQSEIGLEAPLLANWLTQDPCN